MDLVISPTTVALNPQQGAALPALRSGEVVEAQVLQAVGDAAKIAIGNIILEVLTQVALTPGSTVKLAVNNSPQGLRLTLLGTVGGGTTAGAGGAGNISTAPSQTAAAIVTASATIAGSQAAASQVAAPQVAAAQVAVSAEEGAPAGTPSAPTVTTGGSANVASGTPANVAAAASTVDPPAQALPPNPVAAATAALAAAVQSSAARQGGLGPLFADAGVAAGIAAVPEPVRQAAERLLALQPSLDETISASDVKQALDRSGLFLEARLSAAANGGTAPAGSADDLKAALVVLRNVIKNWLATDLPDLVAPGASAQTGGVNGRAALAPGSGGETQGAPNSQAAAPRTPSAAINTPPPPYRGVPTAGQAAAPPSISADTAPRDIGKVLLNETDAALARQTLLQAASLPDSSTQNGTTIRNDPSGPRWLFEVPFATPQGSAVAQFEIARDGRNAQAPGTKAAWRARFSLDVEPIGPVHAQIALIGTRAAVTLWAERPETSAKLRDNAPQLADALRQAELDPGDVLVRGGTPPRPREAVASGRFLDRAS